jgi:hypothetical protein
MNLHVQVRTSTGGTVQVLVWGEIEEIPQLEHLYCEKEENKKTSPSILRPPFIACTSVQVPDLGCKRPAARCQHGAKHIEFSESGHVRASCGIVLPDTAIGEGQERSPPTLLRLPLRCRLQGNIEFRDQDFKGECN